VRCAYLKNTNFPLQSDARTDVEIQGNMDDTSVENAAVLDSSWSSLPSDMGQLRVKTPETVQSENPVSVQEAFSSQVIVFFLSG
jgi:argininosuccinate synthase